MFHVQACELVFFYRGITDGSLYFFDSGSRMGIKGCEGREDEEGSLRRMAEGTERRGLRGPHVCMTSGLHSLDLGICDCIDIQELQLQHPHQSS